MSPLFIFNNLHFAEEIFGSLVFAMVAWLAFDSFAIRKDFLTASRGIGFVLLAISKFIEALGLIGEIYEYIGMVMGLLGLVLVLWNIILERPVPKPSLNAIFVLPPLASAVYYFNFWQVILFFGIAFLSYRQYKDEEKKTLFPFIASFVLLTISSLVSFFYTLGRFDGIWILGNLIEATAYIVLSMWVWQYLRLRIREMLILIFFFASVFISVSVTLAFSMILIGQIETVVKNNLNVNARVVDYLIIHMKEEALSKARILASTVSLKEYLVKNDFGNIQKLAADYTDRENLGFLIVVDKDGNVVLRAYSTSQRAENLLGEKALSRATMGYSVVSVESSPVEKISIRASSPVVGNDGKVVGYVITGFLLDNLFADNLKKITGLDITVFDKDVVAASTVLGLDSKTRISGTKLNNDVIYNNVLKDGSSVVLRTDVVSQPFISSYFPLQDIDDNVVGMISIARSQKDILMIANRANILTLVVVIIIMALLALPIFRVTKSLVE